jgi:hypothetical protein
MLDVDTFLTILLYVTVDDFCQEACAPERRPGPDVSLCASEVIILSLFARWSRFASERDFYRYAQTNLTDAFPSLPERSQFNRLVRSHTELIARGFLFAPRSSSGGAKVPLGGPGQLGHAYSGDCKRREGARVACRTGRHRMVQQLGVV